MPGLKQRKGISMRRHGGKQHASMGSAVTAAGSPRKSLGDGEGGGGGSRKSAAVQALVCDTKAKVSAKQWEGSPFAHHPHSSSSSSSDDDDDDDDDVAGDNSWFEKLYQHGVQRGLKRLSAQHDRGVDVDTSRDGLLNSKSSQLYSTSFGSSGFGSGSSRQQPPQKQQPPCISSTAAAKTTVFCVDGDKDGEPADDWEGGEAGGEAGGGKEGQGREQLHSRVADLLAKRKGRQQADDLQPDPPAANATPDPKLRSAGSSFTVDLPPASSAMGIEMEAFARYRERVLKFYTRYNPEKLCIVDEKIRMYQEDDLMEVLIGKYGPEP